MSFLGSKKIAKIILNILNNQNSTPPQGYYLGGYYFLGVFFGTYYRVGILVRGTIWGIIGEGYCQGEAIFRVDAILDRWGFPSFRQTTCLIKK